MVMSTKNKPVERVVDALEGEDLVPLGSFKAQETGEGGIMVPFPQPHARNAGLQQSSDVKISLHAPTGGIVVIPDAE